MNRNEIRERVDHLQRQLNAAKTKAHRMLHVDREAHKQAAIEAARLLNEIRKVGDIELQMLRDDMARNRRKAAGY